MAKYLSNRQKNLKVGISSYTESNTVLEVTGNVGIKTTDAKSALDVRGTISIGRTDVAGINSIRSVSDINSWEYYGVSFSVAGQDTAPADLYFSPDGTKMYILGDTGNDVNEYTLSTPWEVSTATYVTVFSVAGQETSPAGLYFKPDGTRMYICGLTGVAPTGDRVYSYTLSTPWSLSSASYDNINFNIAQDTAPQGVFLKDDDGTKMYIVGSTGDAVYEYSLGTAWDVSTATFTTSLPIGATNTQNLPLTLLTPVGIDFNASGTKMFIIDQTRDIVTRFNLITPWDISTAVFYDNLYIGFQELTPTGIFYQEDQSRAYIVGATTDTVFQYNTDVPSLELASSGISTRSSVIINNEARLNNRLYVTGDIHASSNTTLNGTLLVNSTGTFAGTLSHTGTSGSLNNTTSANTLNLATGAVGSNVAKVVNVGTGGAANSRTLITLGAATAGAISTVTIPSPTNLLIGSATTTGTANQPLQVTGSAYISGNIGIGTTNATTNLDVNGGLRVRGALLDKDNEAGTNGQFLISTGNGVDWVTSNITNAISGVTIRDEGSIVGTADSVSTINFVGPNVTATASGAGATITIADYVSSSGVATYATSSGIATNLKGGSGGTIVYQSATNVTSFLTNGSPGFVLQSNGGTSAPSWVAAAPASAISGITVREEGSVAGTANSISSINFVGPNVTATASGSASTITIADYVSNAGVATYATSSGIASALTSNASINTTGIITAASFTGSGANLTTLNASNISSGTINDARLPDLITSNINITSGVSTFATVKSTTFEGSLTGNASSATYATTAGIATYASTSGIATYATTSGIATYSTSSGIATNATYATTAGISTTSQGLTGTPNISVGTITAVSASFSGNVSIAGTLTYEDVTSVDSLGIVTARGGIQVGPITSIGTTISLNGNATFAGIITATSFTGSGANLTSLNASNLSSGTVPDARLSGTYTGISINTTGIITATSFTGSGANLTSLNASNLSSGTVSDARLSGTYTGISINTTGIITAASFTGSGANLTSLNASNLSSGTVSDARLPDLITSNINITSGVSTFATVKATTFEGSLTGTATSTTNIPNLSGDVSSNNTVTTLATVNSNVGTYGGTGAIPVVTVNAKGLVTGVSTVAPNNGQLTLGVSGTGLSGSATFTANQSGASTFAVTSNATSDNTNSTIVARNGSGGFSAGIVTATFVGNLTGNVTGNLNSTGVNTATTLSGTTLTYTTGNLTTLNATTGNIVTGIVTNISGTNLNYTGISTITNVRSVTINNTGVTTTYTLNVGTGGTIITTTASGFVGINSTVPGSMLAVGGTITELYNGQFWNVVTQADVGYGASQVPLNQYLGQLAFLDDFSPNGLRRDGGGSDDVVVDLNGNVGIGTTNATSKLTVLGDVSISGVVTATSFTGSGANLTSLNASNLSSGTVPDARLSGTYTGISINTTGIITATSFTGSGANLTSLNASNLSSGTVPDARLSGTYTGVSFNSTGIATFASFTGSGANLTTLNASNLSSGTVPDARLSGTYTGISINTTGIITATSFTGSGANLTALNASNISSGTLNNARLPSNISISGIATINQLDVNQLSPDGTDYGTALYVPVADGLGGWDWQPVASAGAGNLNAIDIREEGIIVGTAGSTTSIDFRGNNIIATGTAGGSIATVRVSDTPTFDSLVVSGVSTSSRFVSTVATGTAPLTVASTTVVTNLNADLLDGQQGSYYNDLTNATGTLADARLSGTYTGISINTTGIVTATSFTGSGANLTALNASNLSSGTVPDARLSGTYTGISINTTGIITATSFTGSGANLTSLNASNISSGTLNNARLPQSISVSGIITSTQFSTGASGTGINITNNTITGPAELTIDPAGVGDNTGSVRIRGNLFVDGTETFINSTTIELADFNVGIATTVGTNSLLDGAGIGIGALGIRKFITWNNTAGALTSSEDWNLASGKQYEINGTSVLNSTTLGSGVVNSSLTSVGTLGQLNVSGVSTFTNGPLLVGSGTSTGTASQRLQVTGGAYVSGDVGIGTTNPADKLHTLGGKIRVDSLTGAVNFWNGAGYYGGIGVAGGMGGSGTDIVIRSDTTRSIIFFTGGANDRGRIDSSGTFLVGAATSTGTASQRLQVTGGAYVSGNVGVGITNPIAPLEVLQDTTGFNDISITNSNTGNNTTKSSRLRFRLTDTVGSRKDVAYIVGYPNDSNSALGGYLSFFTRTLDSTPTEKLRLDNTGNLVLGSSFTPTGTSSQALQVNSGAYVSGNVGVGTTNPQYKLHVVGSFGATTKSFIIDHPTQEGKKLQYACLEGPENSVYVRGKSQSSTIELPEYWVNLVDENSITVNLTPIGESATPRVRKIENNTVEVFSKEDGELDYFYIIFAERKDVPKLEVEF